MVRCGRTSAVPLARSLHVVHSTRAAQHDSEGATMRFDKYTQKAQEAVVRAQETAQARNHAEILPLHLLYALLTEEEGVIAPLLQKLGANAQRIRAVVEGELD